jgi:hypothetical protein
MLLRLFLPGLQRFNHKLATTSSSSKSSNRAIVLPMPSTFAMSGARPRRRGHAGNASVSIAGLGAIAPDLLNGSAILVWVQSLMSHSQQVIYCRSGNIMIEHSELCRVVPITPKYFRDDGACVVQQLKT